MGQVVEYLGSSEQKEKLSAIGTRLSQERQKQSVSLEEIAAKTYIPLRLLSAIEAGKLDSLPEPVFVQGFIRRYAEALGLDGAAISKEFPVNLSPTPVPEPSPSPSQPPLKPLAQSTEVSSKPKTERQFQMPTLPSVQLPSLPSLKPPALPSIPRSTLVATGIGAAVVVGLIAIITAVANRPQTQSAAAPAKSSETRSTPANPPANPPANSTSGVSVKVNVTDDSWAEILVDGKSVFEGTLTKGTQKTWTGKKQVVVSAGNAGGVSVSYNNGAAKSMGGLGEVKEMSFPPKP